MFLNVLFVATSNNHITDWQLCNSNAAKHHASDDLQHAFTEARDTRKDETDQKDHIYEAEPPKYAVYCSNVCNVLCWHQLDQSVS